jgi:hypothetical protein
MLIAPTLGEPARPPDTFLAIFYSFYYVVLVSIPYTTTLKDGEAVLLDATINFPASITIPVLSKTPLAVRLVSNSRYSVAAGVAEEAKANRTLIAAAPLLHIDTVTTENVLEGHVYTVVSEVLVMFDAPNLPVAI